MKKNRWIPAMVLAAALLSACGASENTVAETTLPPTTQATAPVETSVPAQTEAALPAEETEEAFTVRVEPVITDVQEQIVVTTADDFLTAIAPGREIVVDAALLDLSQASDYGTGTGEYYYWAETFDGPELYITGVSNLTIRGAGEDRADWVISAVPRYANVLNFENCSNIHVTGLTAGHAEEPGYCAGGVLAFWNCQDILVENCGLFGCGTLGVKAYSSKAIQIVGNEIYECSVGGVEFTGCDQVNVDGNTFRDLGGPTFRIYDCGRITCDGAPARHGQ